MAPTFHQVGGRGGRTIGTNRSLLVEILGLPLESWKQLVVRAHPQRRRIEQRGLLAHSATEAAQPRS